MNANEAMDVIPLEGMADAVRHATKEFDREAKQRVLDGEMIYTVADVAGILKISRSMVYKLIKRHGLPCFHVGTDTRIFRDDLLTWIDTQREIERAVNPWACG